MREIILYGLIAFLPPLLLSLAAAWLPKRLTRLRWLILLWPTALLAWAALVLAAEPGFWNVLAALWLASLAALALAGFGLGALLGKLIRKRSN